MLVSRVRGSRLPAAHGAPRPPGNLRAAWIFKAAHRPEPEGTALKTFPSRRAPRSRDARARWRRTAQVSVSTFALACALASCPVAGALAAAPDIIPVDQIKPGMTGYGLTVFAGTRVDTFSVRVLGVQDNARVQGSLVLVEVGGHGLELSSIAQGMSGSPVYIDGKFAGALAFGWEGALAPIGGVTPAREMLALPTGPQSGAQARHAGDLDASSLVGERARDGALGLASQLAGDAVAPPAAPAGVAAVAIGAGWPDVLDLGASLLGPLSGDGRGGAPSWLCRPASPAAATGGRAALPTSTSSPSALVPGAACAVSLVSGDADLGAIGTVSWVDGDRVLIFGHPLMQRGAVDLPLAAADIVTILPSRRISFKIGSPGPVVGAVHHDLRAGVAGTLGARAPQVPVDVRIDGAAPGSYHFDVADDAQLTPMLVFWSFYNALLAGGDDASRQVVTWRLESSWRLAGEQAARSLAQAGVASGPGGAAALGADLMTPLALLLDNPFGSAHLERVAITATIAPGRGDAVIDALGGARRVEAGAAILPVTVDLRDADGASRAMPVAVPLPAGLPAGDYRVVAASAAEFFAFEAQRAPERMQPARLADLWELLAAERSPSTLVVTVFAADRPVLVGGRELAAAPGSVSRVVAAGRQPADQALARPVARVAVPTTWALGGHAVRTLHVAPAAAAVGAARRP